MSVGALFIIRQLSYPILSYPIQGVTRGNKGYRRLQGVAKGLQRVTNETGGYKGLQGVTKGYKG